MLIQEPVQAAIWDALNNYAVTDATFLAERLFSEVANDESLYLLATCYYRAGKPVQSYLLLQSRGCHTAQCKYLLAKCCFDTDRLSEAEELLVGNAVSKSKTFEEIEVEYGPVACHVFSLLGNLYSKTERFSHASECYQKSLKLNPLLWSSFAKLCSLVRENNKSQSKSRFTSPKSGTRKSKSKLSKSQQEMNEINKGENILDCKQSCGYDGPNYSQLAHMRQQSLAGILKLLQSMGRAFQALTQYECKRAIELLSELPQHQYQTGWVLCQVARAYFELNNYIQAEKVFAELRELEPYHMEGMDLYSTALWQLQREVELSALAQELTEMNKNAPEKEHDTAIKFFQRAIQVDPNFAYAYTLLGHEYVFTEEFEKGLSSFRNSIRVDSRHYNAWYGVGMIYYKQEKFQLAELHFNKALMINPKSPALLCHVGVVSVALVSCTHYAKCCHFDF
uniref:Cell division cycle protein 27 homolog n=1 Tax=Octopus bimaculoides TaxID=37653 RepID=A0A0L8I4K7_OCTBM